MRHFLFILSLIACSYHSHASSDLAEIASELVIKLENRNVERIALWNFLPVNGDSDTFSKMLTEEFSVAFLNASNTLKIYERNQLEQVINELKLQNSGIVDEDSAKEIGKFTGAEAIVSGSYSLINNDLKIWIKVIETESAFQIAALSKTISIKNSSFEVITKDAKKKGSIKVKNKKKYGLELTLTKGQFSKKVVVGAHSKITLNDLAPGNYSCTASYASSDQILESFDIEVKSKSESKKVFNRSKPLFRMWPVWTLTGATFASILVIGAGTI